MRLMFIAVVIFCFTVSTPTSGEDYSSIRDALDDCVDRTGALDLCAPELRDVMMFLRAVNEEVAMLQAFMCLEDQLVQLVTETRDFPQEDERFEWLFRTIDDCKVQESDRIRVETGYSP